MLSSSLLVEVAAEVRARAGEKEPAFSTHRLVEAAVPGAMVTGRRLPDGVLEVTTRKPCGSALIVYERTLPTPMQRFVIAHALAHLLFDHVHGGVRVGRVGHADREERADRFAAELLVPLDRLVEHVEIWPCAVSNENVYLDHVDEIASRFHVTQDLIDKRIRELRARRNRIALSS